MINKFQGSDRQKMAPKEGCRKLACRDYGGAPLLKPAGNGNQGVIPPLNNQMKGASL